jgi:hypothetical protein
VIDGTLISIDRVAADRPSYSGKHRRHGMNPRVISAPTARSCGSPARCPSPFTTWTPPGSGASPRAGRGRADRVGRQGLPRCR